MNTSYEMTPEEIESWLANRLGKGNVFEQFNRQFCKDFNKHSIAKVLSLLEPVELEGLRKEEINQIFLEYYSKQYGEEAAKVLLNQLPDCNYAKAVSRATIRHNQEKFGTLYRVKEG